MRHGFKLPAWAMTSPYGMRVHPITGDRRMHTGVDYGVARGTSILAVASGTVVGKWFSGLNSGYGHSLKVKNYDGSFSFYAHMDSASKLKKGDVVEVGKTVIGPVGSTGAATGPHLHLEIALDEAGTRTVDPVSYATARPLQPVSQPKPSAKTHVVKRGESLSGIAKKYKTTWQDLNKLNRGVIGPDPNRIFAGQVLRLPASSSSSGSSSSGSQEFYTVKRGDSLWSIAQRRVGGSNAKIQKEVDRLAKLNKLKNPSALEVGQRLRVR